MCPMAWSSSQSHMSESVSVTTTNELGIEAIYQMFFFQEVQRQQTANTPSTMFCATSLFLFVVNLVAIDK